MGVLPAIINGGATLIGPSADGTNAQVLQTDGSGNLSFGDKGGGGTTVAFQVRQNSGQSISNATGTKITWNIEDFDEGSNFASNKFTAPSDGQYYFSAGIQLGSAAWAAGEYVFMQIRVNGTAVSTFYKELEANSTLLYNIHLSGCFDLSTNDYVEVYVQHNQGGSVSVYSANSFYNYFCGFKV